MYPKESTTCNNDNVAEDLLVKYQFSQLFEIPTMDYTRLRDAVKNLELFVTTNKFYKSIHDYVSVTLDFIVEYSHLIINSVDSGSTLSSLLALLKNIVAGINTNALQMNSGYTDTILTLFLKIMESAHENDIKLQVGNILINLMEMHSITSCNKADLLLLISKVCILLDEKEYTFQLSCLSHGLLKWRADMKIEMGPIIETIEFHCMEYINQESDSATVLQLLKCLLTYYQTREENNRVTSILKQKLCCLCVFISNPMFRNSAEQLIAILIEELYCTETVWPGGRDSILEEIKCLPSNYNEWPESNETIFFVIAYLLFLQNNLLWNYKILSESLDRYIAANIMFTQRFVLKAIAMLYPIGVENNTGSNTVKNGRILLEFLGICKYLPELLTYHPTQMIWFLTNAKTAIKMRVLVSWLHTETEDDQILYVLNLTKMGSLLINYFINNPNSFISSRVLQLMIKLTPEPNLEKTIEVALPMVCTRPTVFAQLLQLKPNIPVDHDEILNLLKMTSASLPFLAEDCSFQATCFYSIRLLFSIKHQPNALLMFCHNFVSIKLLIAKSVAANDKSSIAATKLLRGLVSLQITNNVEVDKSIAVDFISILRGSLLRISSGLKLLQLVLTRGTQKVFLNIHKESLFGLYNFMHTLTGQQKIAPIVYEMLGCLLSYTNNLVFLHATTQVFYLTCKRNMDLKSIRPFLKFLEKWLRLIIDKYPHVNVPVGSFYSYFEHIGLLNYSDHRIVYQLLNSYEEYQYF